MGLVVPLHPGPVGVDIHVHSSSRGMGGGLGSISLGQINFHGWGWVAGSYETKANSAQFQVKLPTGAELGNNIIKWEVANIFSYPF